MDDREFGDLFDDFDAVWGTLAPREEADVVRLLVAMLRERTVKDQSELARLARVSQPLMTQIMNLTFLAPDIQERMLFLETVSGDDETVHLRGIQWLGATDKWRQQRDSWNSLRIGPK